MSRSSTPSLVVEAPAGCEERASAICAEHGNRPDELLEIFHALQHEFGYVPEQVLPAIATALNRSRAEVYGVLSFYHDFRRTPPGRHVVKICRAEACQAMHTDKICAHAEEKLGTRFGETSLDGGYSLDAVYCLGNCALSPAMLVDGDLFGCLDEKRFDAIIDDLDKEAAA
jgi:formate dehydrogenase subunit gamma